MQFFKSLLWHPELSFFKKIRQQMKEMQELNSHESLLQHTTWNVPSISKKITFIYFHPHHFYPIKESLFWKINAILTYVSLWNLITIYTIAYFYKIKTHVHVGLQKLNWNDKTILIWTIWKTLYMYQIYQSRALVAYSLY